MARFRYNGLTFDIETPAVGPQDQLYACVVYGPYLTQGPVVLTVNPGNGQPIQLRVFDNVDTAVLAGEDYVRQTLGEEVPFLRRFMNQLKEHEATYPLTAKKLRITPVARLDWRALTQAAWQDDGWGGQDENLTSMAASNEAHLAALKKRLRRVGIVDIEVTNDVSYMEIESVDE